MGTHRVTIVALVLAVLSSDAARADDRSPSALGRPALPPTAVPDARVASRGATWPAPTPAPLDDGSSSAASATLVGGAGDYRYRAGPGDCGCACERWRVALTLPVWIPSVTGSFASGDTDIDTDREPGGLGGLVDELLPDATSSLEFAFMGRVAVQRGPFTVAADGFYAALEETLDWRIRDEDTTGTLRGTVGRLYGAWQATVPLGCGPCAPSLAVGPTLGARLFHLDFHVDRATGDDIDRDKTWVDVLGGVRADVTFANRASVSLLADYGGGFDGSHSSWSVTAELAWPLGRGGHWFVLLGWTLLDLEHDTGSGDGRYEASLYLSGPHVGITYQF